MQSKKIAFIPPNGEIIEQDFALDRIINYFDKIGIECFLLLNNQDVPDNRLSHIHKIIFHGTEKIIQHLEVNQYDLIFSRTWMHRYSFGAELAKRFDNVITYIKDWHNFPKDVYEFVYKTVDDIKAIQEIFQYSQLVLSHYSNEYMEFLYREYNIHRTKNYFFFPEYSHKNNFYEKIHKSYNIETIKIVFAGGGTHSSIPSQIGPVKSFLFTIAQLSEQKISVTQMVLAKFYKRMEENPILYQDLLYENQFNPFFSLKLGENLMSSIGENYHFGIFTDSNYQKNNLFEYAEAYAITSKFAFYLECGLPLLVNKRFKTLSQLIEEHHIGLTFDDEDLKDFKKVLNISEDKYHKIVTNIYTFREKFTYNNKTMEPLFNLFHKEL